MEVTSKNRSNKKDTDEKKYITAHNANSYKGYNSLQQWKSQLDIMDRNESVTPSLKEANTG